MAKRKPSLQSVGLQPYRGTLSATDCATAIQAARLNARELFKTAKLLFDQGRYAHSLAFSVLAIEETGKQNILMALFLGLDEPEKAWADYRAHTAKTALFNFAIEQRVMAEFPQVEARFAKQVATSGPKPEDLDAAKQLTLYSDCFLSPEGPAVHFPMNIDWREKAEHLLVEAQVLVNYMRDYPQEELEVWRKHWNYRQGQGLSQAVMLKSLHEELLQKGFIKAGQWEPILRKFGYNA
jgi:AbiV family abortive infection protein